MFREQLWRVVMTVPRLLEQVVLRQNSNKNHNKQKIEKQVERPKCGNVAKKKEEEDWDERVTDAGDWKKVNISFSSLHYDTLCNTYLQATHTIYALHRQIKAKCRRSPKKNEIVHVEKNV